MKRRSILFVLAGVFLVVALICGGAMRHALRGAADPDTQETTVLEITSTISERIASLGNGLTKKAVQQALTDQLSPLGKRGFIRIRIPAKGIDVLVGTDYGLQQVDTLATRSSWSYRMSLSPVDAPDILQPLYVSALGTETGDTWVQIMIGSAGPTDAQSRAAVSFMTTMWASLCCAAACLLLALFPYNNHAHRAGPFWTPMRRGTALVLAGLLVAVPVAWTLLRNRQTTERTWFARGVDQIAARCASTLSDAKLRTNLSAAWLHASYSMYYPDSSFRLLVSGKLLNSAGTDYGPGAYLRPGASGEWRALSPSTGGPARSVYVTAASKGTVTVALAVPESSYWQVTRLRTILLIAIPAALALLFLLGYFLGHRPTPAIPTPEEVLRRTVLRQTAFTILIVCLALLPAAGWFLQAYEAASLGRLDQSLQQSAMQFQSAVADLGPANLADNMVEMADQLEIARTGLLFSLQTSAGRKGSMQAGITLYPQYSTLTTVAGASRPQERIVANRTDPSLPTGANLHVLVLTFSNRLKDGTVYTALLGTTLQSVREDMRELWTSALWAGPVALLFIVLASLAAAVFAQRPVRASMRRLEQFTGDAGHELRTPLGSIRLNAQVALAQDREPQEYQRHLAAILSQADRAARMDTSLLLLAQLDHPGEVPLEPVHLAGIWTDLQAAFAGQLAERKTTLAVPQDDPAVTANRDLLAMALSNLVENAVQYAPERSTITLTTNEEDGCVRISVIDQGPGIPQEDLPHIWDRFYRVDRSRSRASGGSGLGLAIVRQAVEAMHGHVAVHSELGKGSTFSLLLPRAQMRP